MKAIIFITGIVALFNLVCNVVDMEDLRKLDKRLKKVEENK